jgi:DNA repair protein RadA
LKLSDDLGKLEDVSSSTLAKLRAAGITTIEALSVTPVKELIDRLKLQEETAYKLIEQARKIMNYGFVKATELLERRKNVQRCTTGSAKLDKILGGGIETQAMTELIGDYGVGKTQLCMTLAVVAQLPPEQGGFGSNVIYMDTEGTFSPERVYQIASKRDLDGKKILDGVVVARAYTSDHQRFLIDCLFRKIPEEKARLVIVDSIISHFRGEYVGREDLSMRQQVLNQYLHKLLRMTEAYNIALVVTNQVQANPVMFYGNPERPAGGHVMAHACTHRVHIRRGKSGTRVAKVIDSPYLPEAKASFIITAKGIEDTDKQPEEVEEEEEQPQASTQKI